MNTSKKIQYAVDHTGLITTKCSHYNCVVGGYYCVNCTNFAGKNMENKSVQCLKHESQQRVEGLPPQRKKQQQNNN